MFREKKFRLLLLLFVLSTVSWLKVVLYFHSLRLDIPGVAMLFIQMVLSFAAVVGGCFAIATALFAFFVNLKVIGSDERVVKLPGL